ncbi:MAG: hypothetical protein Q8N42_01360 [bacterium]|nr:hypothetical protein [bacterium]
MDLKEIEKEIREIKEIQNQFAEKEKEIGKLHEAIEKAIIALDQTKKIFKSKAIAQIRESLIDILPLDKQTKFICLGCGIKREAEPSPEPPEIIEFD